MKPKDPGYVVTSIFFYQFITFLHCKAYNKWIIITELVLEFSPDFPAEFTVYLFYVLSGFCFFRELRVYFFFVKLSS